ncbi:hypothetical protein CI088_07560 [Enterococcus plantarum]|uniref:Uncharacterized protein n=1 Tax=Enterococcus plantarum TaxID=1077675 RepID=A0A2W3ZZY6_9ENTE|nr:hypothetical protein CI088_07560 [Enterococcus plantarum]
MICGIIFKHKNTSLVYLFCHFYFSKGVLIFEQQNNPDANQVDWYLDFSLGLMSQAHLFVIFQVK